jgi:hypothetical protein
LIDPAWSVLCFATGLAQTAGNINEIIAWQPANRQSAVIVELIQSGTLCTVGTPCTL